MVVVDAQFRLLDVRRGKFAPCIEVYGGEALFFDEKSGGPDKFSQTPATDVGRFNVQRGADQDSLVGAHHIQLTADLIDYFRHAGYALFHLVTASRPRGLFQQLCHVILHRVQGPLV